VHPGAVARDEALDRVEQAADDQWKDVAIRAVRWLAGMHTEFTTDAVWAAIEHYHPTAQTHEPRAMGPIMMRAKSLKYCEPTDRTVLSTRTQNHRRPIRVWKSTL